MATWEDGPEYAPRRRPAEFREPEPEGTVPLSVAPPRPRPSLGAPGTRPRFEQQHRVDPLPDATVIDEEPRDPSKAFQVTHSTLTTAPEQATAWGAAHMPIQLSSGATQLPGAVAPSQPGTPFGPIAGHGQRGQFPGQPAAYPPPSGLPAGEPGPPNGIGQGNLLPAQQNSARGSAPLTFGSFYRSLSPFVLFSLLGAVIVSPISIFLYFLAFWFSARWVPSRTEYYRSVVTNTYWVGVSLVGTTMVLALLIGPTLLSQWWSLVNQISQIAAAGTLAVVAGVICYALNIGRAPDPDPGRGGSTAP